MLDRVIAASPDEIDALWLRARIAAGRADKVLARQLAEHTLELEPAHARARVILARILFEEREYERSLELWSGIGRSDSAFRESVLKSGKCLVQLKRPAEVVRLAREALSLNPSDAEARRMLLDSYVALGCDSLALEEAKILAAAAPDDKKVTALLGRLEVASPASAAISPSILADLDLRDWMGQGEQTVSGAARVSRGVSVCPRDNSGSVNVRVAPPVVYRADSLPSFGLDVSSLQDDFDVRFDLDAGAASVIDSCSDFYFEARSRDDAASAHLELAFGINEPEFVRRRISEFQIDSRARLFFFRLSLAPDELKAVADGVAVLEFRFRGGCQVLFYPPRPFGIRICSQP